jgi:hypothetical protein
MKQPSIGHLGTFDPDRLPHSWLINQSGSAFRNKFRTLLISLGAAVLAFALGYGAGHWRGVRAAAAADLSYNAERAQESGEFETLAYYHCLQAMDAGNTTNLQSFAQEQLRGYVWDIQQLRAEGHAWAPHIPWLYTNATVYLAEHPHKGG